MGSREELANYGADLDSAAGCSDSHRLKDRSADPASNNTCDGIFHRSKTCFFECRARHVAADSAANQAIIKLIISIYASYSIAIPNRSGPACSSNRRNKILHQDKPNRLLPNT